MASVCHILLPSFLRRALRAFELKALIRSSGCELSRIGRSRNWRLSATREQMSEIIEKIHQSDEASWQWLIPLLEKNKGNFTQTELLNLVRRNPQISVNELVIMANCTIAEARKAIDVYEWGES
ncbi:ribosome recycling factor family protein [Thalassotalea aquiviva]|uniref:ribosome recycling factor family protein n=1 Tax=Thalassotalea aquiviva TaxID=3242415 RepID=UPI00352A02D2